MVVAFAKCYLHFVSFHHLLPFNQWDIQIKIRNNIFLILLLYFLVVLKFFWIPCNWQQLVLRLGKVMGIGIPKYEMQWDIMAITETGVKSDSNRYACPNLEALKMSDT